MKGATTDARPSVDDTIRWFSLLFGSDLAIEVRAPGFSRPGTKPFAVVSRFGPGQVEQAAREALRLSGHAPGVYVVMNGVRPDLPLGAGLKGKDVGARAEHVPRRRLLLVDCDPKRPADTSATEGEKSAAFRQADAVRSWLRLLGWPEPILADSGNGYHLLYRIDQPNDGAATELVRSVLSALAARFDTAASQVDQKVFDPPRLVKAYGTLVAKGDDTPERPHRYARILSAPAEPEPVPAELLELVAAEARPADKPAGRKGGGKEGVSVFTMTASGRLDPESRAVRYLAKCPPAISGEKGHDKLFWAACQVGPGFDLSPEVAFRLLRDHYNPTCQPPWSEKELWHKVEDAYRKRTSRGFLLNTNRNGSRNGYHGNGRPSANGKAAANGHHARTDGADGEGVRAAVDYQSLSRAELGLTRAADIDSEPVDWLWEDRIPLGMLSLLAGEGGEGKSQISVTIAAAVSTGGKLPDGSQAPLGRVIILAAEDSARKTIIPRLKAAGADTRNVDILVAKVTVKDPKGRTVVSPRCLSDLDYWRAVFTRGEDGQPPTRLFVVDTLPGLMKGINDSKNNEIRALVEPFLDDVLDPLNIAMLGITHMNKSVDHKTPIHKILGSVAYPNLSRSVFCTYRDPEDRTRSRRFMCHVKINVGEERPTLAYSVQKVELSEGGRTIKTARVVFEPDPVDLSAQDIMNNSRPGNKPGPKGGKTAKAAEWLYDYLDSPRCPVPLKKVFDAAGEAGLIGKRQPNGKWSGVSTLYDAKEALPNLPAPRAGMKVEESVMEGFGGRDVKHWYLVEADTDVPF